MAPVVVQIRYKALYKHEYFLNIEEVPNDQSDEDFEPISKRPKKPVTKESCKEFSYMQPSACTFADYNHLQASKIECDAVVALATKESSINVILYHDTTSKNSTDGE